MAIKRMIIALVLCSVMLVSGCSEKTKEEVPAQKQIYVVFNNSLCTTTATYTESMLGIEAVMLDKQIGETSDGKQVFSIYQVDPNEYICLRIEGEERIFQNSRIIGMSDVNGLEFSKLVIRKSQNIEDKEEINDKAIIDAIICQLVDESIVIGEVVGVQFWDFTFYSEKIKGTCYKYSYVIDEYGDAYLYDPHLGYAWKMVDKIFEIE